jgi:hypothetical protein
VLATMMGVNAMAGTDKYGNQTRTVLLADLAVERFADAAVILLVASERFLTVNLAAADILEVMRTEYGVHPFEERQLAGLLMAHYELSEPDAGDAAGHLVSDWLAAGVLTEVGHD